MKRCVCLIAAVISGALTVSGCTTNPYTGERETGKSAIGTGLDSPVSAGADVFSSSKKDRGKGAFIGTTAGAALGGGVGHHIDVREAKLCDEMCGTGVSVTRSGDSIILNMPNNVTSDSSSATLKSAGANTLTGVAMILKEYPKTAVNVTGCTDGTEDHDLNMRPSQQRMSFVASTLITRGAGVSCIHVQGLGPTNPIANNSTAEGKA